MDSVLVASEPVPEGTHEVRGVDFDKFQGRDITVAELVENLTHTGFQGSAVAEAARIINDMVCLRCGQYDTGNFLEELNSYNSFFSGHIVTPRPAPKPLSSSATRPI